MKRFFIPIVLFFLSAAESIYCTFALFRDYDLAVAIICTVGIVAFIPLSSVLHELGHMLFGAMVKIKAVPSIKLIRPSSCKIIPKTDKGLRGRFIFIAFGGLFVNAVFMVLGLLALIYDVVPTFLCMGLPASFYLFFLNILPVRYDSGNTDGLTVLSLAKKDGVSKVTLAVLTAQAQVLSGKSYAELDESLLFDLPQIAEDEESFMALTELRYEYFNAKGDVEQAEKYKRRFEELKDEYM